MLSGQKNTKLQQAVRKAMETPQKEATVVTPLPPQPTLPQLAAEKKKRRRHGRPMLAFRPIRASLKPQLTIIAVFRVVLQSLLEFATSTSPAHFPQGVVSHHFQYMMTDAAAETVAGIVARLRLQFLNTSQVDINWWDLVNKQ